MQQLRAPERYILHSLIATLFVTATPLATVWWLERNDRIEMGIASFLLGIALSLGVAALGSSLWMRHPGSRDIVFADLMLWGLIRRLRTEKYLKDIRELLNRSPSFRFGSTVDPDRQIETLQKLSLALEVADPYTHGHTARVARHAEMIAKAMRLPAEEVELIRLAGAVHDVGKVFVPQEVLTKPGKLTGDEYAAMKEHAPKGGDLVSEVGNLELTMIVRHHHERLDGKGYPDGLAGEAIPLGSRVLAVADTFDAITSTRSYRPAARHKEAIEILKREAGTQLDTAAVDAFLAYYAGRTSLAWWASLTTAPQRLLGQLLSLLREAGVAGIANTAFAAGAAAVVTLTALTPGAVASASSRSPRAERRRDPVAQHHISPSKGPLSFKSTRGNSGANRTGDDGSVVRSDHREQDARASHVAEPNPGEPSDSSGDQDENGSHEGPSGSDDASDGGSVGSTVDDVADTTSDAVEDVVGVAEDTADELEETVDEAGGLVDNTVSLLSP